MFSLDAMTCGQHAISTAASSSSSLTLSGSSSSINSLASTTGSTYGACKPRKKARTNGRSKSKASTATTAELTDEATGAHQVLQHEQRHEGHAASERPLKDYQLSSGFDIVRSDELGKKLARNNGEFVIRSHRVHSSDPNNNNNHPESGDSLAPAAGKSAGKFRYVVAALIILGVALSAYASNTMYIAAIEMISNDVLQSGLTSLKARHLSNDPLALDKNAAMPGTCPKEAAHQSRVAQLIEAKLLTLMNASEISRHERQAMAADTLALEASIAERIAKGQLVDWTISQRGYIFTAHNIGTILLAVPVSRLGLIYGSKTMTFWCIFLSSLRMLLLPTLAGYTPFWATFAFETLIGGIGGNIIILGYPIAAAWLLPDEANFFVAINILSSLCGIAATNFISTQLLTGGLAWCWCYYLPGVLLLALALAWLVWGADRPERSRFVSQAELELLQASTIAKQNACELARHQLLEQQQQQHGGQRDLDSDLEQERASLLLATADKLLECHCASELERESCPANKTVRKPNWMTIFTCPTVWALILVAFANHWTAKIATMWPTFFSNILHLKSSTIGIMLGIKGVFALIFGTIFAIVTRKLIVQRPFGMSLTAYRRWNQAIATSLYAISIVLVVFLDCDILANFAALLIQPLVSSFNSISCDQLPLDMSAEDSGLLVSVVRLISVGDILALPVASYVLSYAPNALAGNRHTWRIVWLVGFALRFLASLYFVLVAKSKPKSYSHLEPAGPCRTAQAAAVARAAAKAAAGTLTTGDHRYV